MLPSSILRRACCTPSPDTSRVALAGNLVYLVYKDDPLLGHLDVVVGVLQEPREDALHIFAHIPRLGEDGGIDYGEGDVEHLGYGAGQQRFTGAGGPHE